MRLPPAKYPGTRMRLHPVNVGVADIPAFAGVYRLVCVPMGMAYIGSTRNLARRAIEHQVQLREGTHPNGRLQGAYRKLGAKAFYFEVLEAYHGELKGHDTLSPMEQRWMDLHPRVFNGRPAGTDRYLDAKARRLAGTQGEAGADNRPPGRVRIRPADKRKDG